MRKEIATMTHYNYTEYNNKIWRFYLQLENDFISTLNYVELSRDNYNTYSKEYTKQLLSICSEIDVVCKELCYYTSKTTSKHIGNCIKEIYKYYKNQNNDFTDIKIKCLYTDETLQPMKGWTPNKEPFWWKNYNQLKHQRTKNDNMKQGNLKNVYLALGALYILNRLLCQLVCNGQAIKDPMPQSTLFTIIGWNSYIPIGNDFIKVLQTNGNISIKHE